ncbi:hypothetical protein HK099_001270 [Clydaea vesicula]|uniref:Groucho/TLE N-terminal Q-rich domain-containing protein n=1 Tax=Clydaea vesicula TaxID=447962 RepID=A0AAD5XZR8_9FUNG|nr:hypothetical protein HK099_001270 [Clydaea vesicula]
MTTANAPAVNSITSPPSTQQPNPQSPLLSASTSNLSLPITLPPLSNLQNSQNLQQACLNKIASLNKIQSPPNSTYPKQIPYEVGDKPISMNYSSNQRQIHSSQDDIKRNIPLSPQVQQDHHLLQLPSRQLLPSVQPMVQNVRSYPANNSKIFDYCEKIKEEFSVLEYKVENNSREKSELHLQYAKHWEMAYQLNAEVHKQVDINNRYQAIINQLLPMLTPNVQAGVRQDMESIKSITDSTLPPPPQAPVLLNDMREERITPPNGVVRGQLIEELDAKNRGRGRPSKVRMEAYKEELMHPQNSKRSRLDNEVMENSLSPRFPAQDSMLLSQQFQNQNLATQHLNTPPFISRRGSVPQIPPPRSPTSVSLPSVPRGLTLLNPDSVKSATPKGVQLIATLPHGEVVCALALSHPFHYVYTGGRGIVKIWDVSNMNENRKGINVGSLDCLDNYIRAIHITRDSKTMIVGGEARFIVICDISSGNPTITGNLQTPNQLTYALCTSKDSSVCFSCCSDGSINMWDLHTLQLVKTFDGHGDSVTCCCLTPDGQKLITGSLDKTVRVWDITEGTEHCQYTFNSQIFSLGVCPMEPIIAAGLETSAVDVRFLSNFDMNRTLRLHDSCVLGLKYSPNGSWFVTSGKDHKWIAWKSLTCETLFQQLENSSILSCDISRDGKYIVTGYF